MDSYDVLRGDECGFADTPDDDGAADFRYRQILAEKQKRRDISRLLGKARGIERSHQRLPIQSNYLGPISVIRLRRALITELGDGGLCSNLLRGALATAACMVTGRSLARIHELTIRRLDPPFQPRRADYGLISVGKDRGWWLPSGHPSSRQSVKGAGVQTIWPQRGIWLPCTQLLLHLLRCSLRERGVKELESAIPLFDGPLEEIRKDTVDFIYKANKEYDCKLTLPRVEGWLRRTIYNAQNGDLAVAHVITNSKADPYSDSVCHYTCLSYEDALRVYQSCVSPFDTISGTDASVLKRLKKSYIGGRYRPRQDKVRALADGLRAEIRPKKGKRRNPLRVHNAMVLYTVTLIALATGFRPVRFPLPHPDMVDEETGFVVIGDKKAIDNYTARLSWLPAVARQQLRFFYKHLDRLKEYPEIKPNSITRFINDIDRGSRLFFFNDRGKAIELSQKRLQVLLKNHGIHLPRNFGRHYLRNALVGTVDSDTLHAFFGHWHSGTEPWGRNSALDPLAFRDAIAAPLEELLARDKWIALPGLARPRRPPRTAPDDNGSRVDESCK